MPRSPGGSLIGLVALAASLLVCNAVKVVSPAPSPGHALKLELVDACHQAATSSQRWTSFECKLSLLRLRHLDNIKKHHKPTLGEADVPFAINGEPGGWRMVLATCIYVVGIGFAIFSIKDIHRFVMLLARREVEDDKHSTLGGAAADVLREVRRPNDPPSGYGAAVGQQQDWSVLALVCLTSYRFYTGFLTATWLPYLLAMEGQDLWLSKQSLFMGIAKLIYAMTVLMNPIFGLIGDQAATLSYGVGRRLYIRTGVTLAAIGIYICVLSAQTHNFMSFLSGLLIWRLGEAINDVTSEALIPDLVPQSQYRVASAVKACSFLLGGLFGYILLMNLADIHYSWLYLAYPIGMFTCTMPVLLLLDEDLAPVKVHQRGAEGESFMSCMVQAYITPMTCQGGFPHACLAVFTFSLGTAPMLFLLLIVRDLVGITNPVDLQKVFSASSMLFFVSAAVASVLSAVPGGANHVQERSEIEGALQVRNDYQMLQRRGQILVYAIIVFGLIVLLIPSLALISDPQVSNAVFFSFTLVLGAAFGIVFSVFQDMTWQILPSNENVANAMGFNVMSRLLGVGIGNFLCGLLLESAVSANQDATGKVYDAYGYVIVCCFSGFALLTSSVIARSSIEAWKTHSEQQMIVKEPTCAA